MKKVQIPVCDSPFIVYVNGVKYIYPSGTEQEVPDDVADVIEQHDEYHKEKDRIDKEGDGSQGGGSGGGGFSTCKVRVSFTYGETDNGVGIIYATMRNGKPSSDNLRYGYTYDEMGEQIFPSQTVYDLEVICGSHLIIGDDYFTGFGVQGDLLADSVGGCKCAFVPGDKANYSISISQ